MLAGHHKLSIIPINSRCRRIKIFSYFELVYNGGHIFIFTSDKFSLLMSLWNVEHANRSKPLMLQKAVKSFLTENNVIQ